MITVRNLTKQHRLRDGAVQALRGVSLSVPTGSFYTVLGPSGCGKTTLLRCIAGLETPDGGEILLGSFQVFSAAQRLNIPPHRRNLGMVFQTYAIWPHLTVFGNAAFPLRTTRVRLPAREVRTRVARALEMVGLGDLGTRPATRLSGGQQQRLALARAIVAEPEVLLFDEPLSNLDARLRAQMRVEIRRLQRRLGSTTVYVTHDQSEALAMSDHIAVMSEGQVVQTGRALDVYRAPTSRFVAEFLGDANILAGQIETGDGVARVLHCQLGLLHVAPEAGSGAPGPATVAVRPEAVELHPGAAPGGMNTFAGVIESVQFVGTFAEYEIRVGSAVLRVRTPPGRLVGTQEAVWVHIPPGECVILHRE